MGQGIWAAWEHLCRQCVAEQDADGGVFIPARVLALHLAGLVVACLLAFSINWPLLFHSSDGIYLLEAHRLSSLWGQGGLTVSSHPLQGMGEQFSFPNLMLFPANALSMLLVGDVAFPTLIYLVIAIELFLAVAYMCRCLGAGVRVALVAGWMLVVLAMEFSWPPLLHPIANVVPTVLELMVAECLFIALLARIGRGPRLGTLMRMAAIAALLVWGVSADPLWFTICIPPSGMVGLALALGAADRRERRDKLLTLFGVVPATLAILSPYYAGALLYNDVMFFEKELLYADVSGLGAVSIFFDTYWAANRPLFVAGVGGAVLTLLVGTGPLRPVARSVLAVVALLLPSTVYFLIYQKFGGPSTARFEMFIWPLYAMFAALMLVAAWPLVKSLPDGVGRAIPIERVQLAWIKTRLRLRFLRQVRLCHPALLIFPIVALAVPPFSALKNCCPWAAAPQENAIVKHLRSEIAVRPGDSFRGQVATFTGFADRSGGISWMDLSGIDVYLHRRFGNDMRTLGLWHFDIPTMIYLTHGKPPTFHLTTSRLLARAQDRQMRGVEALSRVNLPYLSSVGVRFAITDFPVVDPGARLVTSLGPDDGPPCPACREGWSGRSAHFNRDLPESEGWTDSLRAVPAGYSVYLYELAAPNLASYSPTRVHAVATAAESMVILESEGFDFRREAVMAEILQEPLVAASEATMTLSRGKRAVSARSDGTSLLLLPVQYSNCIDVQGSPGARLVRVNLMQAGLLFSGSVEVDLRLSFGPFSNPFCRLKDMAEMRRIAVGDVPNPAERQQ